MKTNFLPLQQRPRSLPIAIQQPKNVLNDDEINNNSSFCPCTINSSQKNHFLPYELLATTSENGIELRSNEQPKINQKNSLEHFIMSPTDKVKIQMKYQENDIKNVNILKKKINLLKEIFHSYFQIELKISQPEDIDFKRSKQKAIRVLYQNRLHPNSIQSPVGHQV